MYQQSRLSPLQYGCLSAHVAYSEQSLGLKNPDNILAHYLLIHSKICE